MRQAEGEIPEEDRAGYEARISREAQDRAEADQADERAKIRTYGMALIPVVAVLVSAYTAVVKENAMMAAGGAIVALVALGIVSVADGLKLAGRK